MKLHWVDGTPLYCRRCDAEVPHYEWRNPYALEEGLRDGAGHVQSAYNAIVSLSVADDVDPALMLLPRRSWTAPYLARRGRLLAQWASKS